MPEAQRHRLESRAGAEPVGTGGVATFTLDDYWRTNRDERTGIGELVHRAKDQGDPKAASELAERFAFLAERFADLAGGLPAANGDLPRLVTPVPSGPTAHGNDDRPHLAEACSSWSTSLSSPVDGNYGRPHLAELLAASLAGAGAGEYRPGLVVKSNPTPRLRHVDPERRSEVAASAGYRAREPVAGRHIVVVDDVVLTGTTLNAVAACLFDAGAASVTAAVAARTRLRKDRASQ